ncbi:hypothetical protein ACL7TT_06875 [Microbulbifer sp. 2304DJ12-6]|uniref:hypothetical protein n=1 Tax=Microbulbifer sp. 2304DJ12-6 TaxID=3233340 RepID=UPI0039AF6F38
MPCCTANVFASRYGPLQFNPSDMARRSGTPGLMRLQIRARAGATAWWCDNSRSSERLAVPRIDRRSVFFAGFYTVSVGWIFALGID